MILNLIFGSLALLSLALTLWQWLVARRFPLHQRAAETSPRPASSPQPSTLNSQPALTLLKPLKGCDAFTEACLRSWFTQQYRGPVQILFGVATNEDPACGIVRKLLQEFPGCDAQLVVGTRLPGANAKVAKLAGLEALAKHELLIISDADVRVPPDFLANLVAPLCEVPPTGPEATLAPSEGERTPRRHSRFGPLNRPLSRLRHPLPLRGGEGRGEGAVHLRAGFMGGENPPQTPGAPRLRGSACGLVCCFYRLANPATLAMQCEAIAINADFWSQVLQSRSLKPLDFALGAVMATRRQHLREIGGFAALADCLADDYQLGNRIARRGHSLTLSPVVVECWSAPMGWAAVWKHQLRWARTIRVCQPAPYFFSLLSNATLWPLLWLIVSPSAAVLAGALVCCLVRILTALDLQRRLSEDRARRAPGRYGWLIPVKDLMQAALWFLAFLGNHIEWRGQRMRLRPDGTLQPINQTPTT